MHQASALGDQLQAIFQAEHARHTGRHIFAHDCARAPPRAYAPRLPQFGQRIFDGEERRLGERCLVDVDELTSSPDREIGYDHAAMKFEDKAAQKFIASIERLAKDRLRFIQLRVPCPTYCAPCPVNRKTTSGCAIGRACSGDHVRRWLAGGDRRAKVSRNRSTIIGDDG